MNRMPNMSRIPNLPLGNYYDQYPPKKEYPRSQTLGYFNGYAIQKRGSAAATGSEMSQQELNDLMNHIPSITYPQAKQTDTADSTFVPGYVAWDKKVMRFKAWFKETVPDSAIEEYRVRLVDIFYYLVDDSMAIVEPTVDNSGLVQGRLVSRHRLPKNAVGDPWRWQDLNVGMDIGIYGRVFHIYDCDSWTRDFMESEGYAVNASQSSALDPYMDSRTRMTEAPRKSEAPTEAQKLKQFLEMDRKVLRFYCVWDDRDTPYGDVRKVILHYYLANDTLEVVEVHKANDGRDPFPLLMSRQRIPKVAKVKASLPPTSLPLSGSDLQDPRDCLTPGDLWIGQTLDINGRRFLLYDCDPFTKDFYRKNFGLTDFCPISIDDKGRPITKDIHEAFTHTGHGCLEDSLQMPVITSLIPRPARKDDDKEADNEGVELRYEAILDSQRPEDKGRRFVICYRLSDDLMTIFEPIIKNSGFLGGRFLERSRVAKPGSCPERPCFYGPHDFYIGSAIDVFRHRFIITSADAYVLKYMEQHPTQFPDAVIRSVREKLTNELNAQNGNRRQQRSAAQLKAVVQEVRGQLRKLSITANNRKDRLFLGVDVGRYGYITKDNIRQMCLRQQLPADNDIIDVLAKGIGKDPDHITLEEFRSFLETDQSRD